MAEATKGAVDAIPPSKTMTITTVDHRIEILERQVRGTRALTASTSWRVLAWTPVTVPLAGGVLGTRTGDGCRQTVLALRLRTGSLVLMRWVGRWFM